MLAKAWNKIQGTLGKDASDNKLYNYEEMTQQTMGMNISILSSYIMNAYRFNNLPEEIDQNLLWAVLTQQSSGVMFYNEKVNKFMFLPYTRKENVRSYNFMFKPTLVEARDFSGKTYLVRTDGEALDGEMEGVILHISNTSRFNMDLHHMLFYYATKMTDIDRSIDVRRNYHRAPAIFSGDEKLKGTFTKLFEGITDFKPFFMVTDLMMEQFNTMNMDFNYISDKLYGEKKQYQNEFLNLWGINNNVSSEKKERMIVDEVNANDEQLLINRDNVLNSLNAFSKEFNEKFGHFFGDMNEDGVIDNSDEVVAVFKRATVHEVEEVEEEEDYFDETERDEF